MLTPTQTPPRRHFSLLLFRRGNWKTGQIRHLGISGSCLQGTGSPLHSCMHEVQEGSAVLAPVEAHAELGEPVLSQGGLNGLQGTCHLFP